VQNAACQCVQVTDSKASYSEFFQKELILMILGKYLFRL